METTHGKPTARIVRAGAFEHTTPTLQCFFQPAELDLPALIRLRMLIIVTSQFEGVHEVIQPGFVKWNSLDKEGFIHSASIIPEIRLV